MSKLDIIFMMIAKEFDKLDLKMRCNASVSTRTRTIHRKEGSKERVHGPSEVREFLEDSRVGIITIRDTFVYVTSHPSLMEDHHITLLLSDPQLIGKIIAHVTITLNS